MDNKLNNNIDDENNEKSTKKIINIKILLIIVFILTSILLSIYLINSSNKYTIKFISDNEQYSILTNIEKNSLIYEPMSPTKENYIFTGWYYNEEKFDFTTKITKDITLIAKWKKNINKEENNKKEEKNKYTINFNTDGGSFIPSQIIEENAVVTKPNNPTKEGYTFIDWYYNEEKFDFTTKITKNITLIAKWKENIIKIKELSLDQETYYMFEGDSVTINYTITPNNATNKTILWSSSNQEFASVTNGTVIAHKAGEVTITATADEISKTVKLIILKKCGYNCMRIYSARYCTISKEFIVDINKYRDIYSTNEFGVGGDTVHGVVTSQNINGITIKPFDFNAAMKDIIYVFYWDC